MMYLMTISVNTYHAAKWKAQRICVILLSTTHKSAMREKELDDVPI